MRRMIRDLQLTNFRAFEALSLKEIPAILAVAGRNNCGKSAVLHALAYPKYVSSGSPILGIGGTADLVHAGAAEARVDFTLSGRDENPASASYLVRPGVGALQFINPSNGSAPQALLRDVFYLVPHAHAPASFTYAPLTTDVGPSGEKTWHILRELKDAEDPRFQTILTWLGELGMGVDKLRIPSLGGNHAALVPVTYGDPINIHSQGSGLGSVLPILVQGTLCEPGQTLLLEEPETHLHRAAINTLVRFFGDCQSRGVQVIFTTHSLDFLVAMNERIEERKLPEGSRILIVRRDTNGIASGEIKDPGVFTQLRRTIKADLAQTGG